MVEISYSRIRLKVGRDGSEWKWEAIRPKESLSLVGGITNVWGWQSLDWQ